MLTVILLILPIVWFLTDPRNWKERIKAYFRVKSIFFLFAEALLVSGTLAGSIYFPWPKTQFESLIVISGQLIFFTGIFLAVWAKITMKSNWNIPAEYHKRQKEVVTDGPFRFSRNPIYLGLILVVLGYALALESYTILLVPLIAFYFSKAILKEEKILTKHFGKEYLEYKAKVSRFIKIC